MNTAKPFPTLLSPLKLGTHAVRNRTLMGSMHTGLELIDAASSASPPSTAAPPPWCRPDRQRRLAVDEAAMLNDHGPQLMTTEQADALRPIPQAVHAAGGKIILQVPARRPLRQDSTAGRCLEHPLAHQPAQAAPAGDGGSLADGRRLRALRRLIARRLRRRRGDGIGGLFHQPVPLAALQRPDDEFGGAWSAACAWRSRSSAHPRTIGPRR